MSYVPNIDKIKEKLIERVKGTVTVYHFYETETNQVNLTINIQNYAHVYHYTIYDLESKMCKGITINEMVNDIIKQYRFTLFAKFFRTPRKQEIK